jgi:putative DNA primase/helicase
MISGATRSLTKTLNDAGFGDILDTPRFVLYKRVLRDDKWTKVPKQKDGSSAKSTDPSTWCTFHDTLKAFDKSGSNFDGIGIILGDHFGTKVVGVDFDHVVDPLTRTFTNPEAEMAAAPIKTYGEFSVSGDGCHFLFLNQDVPKGYKTRSPADGPFDLEVYEDGRYFTLSGDWFNGMKITTDKDGLDGVAKTYLKREISLEKVAAKDKAESHKKKRQSLDDALKNDDKFAAVYNGKRPYGDESRDDMALINYLVRYCGRNEQKIKDIFLASPHFESKDNYHKEKITAREDYIYNTIQNAISSFYVGYTFDDIGNSNMFSDTYADELIFVPEWNMWVHWNGQKWEKRAEYVVQEKAKELADLNRIKVEEYKQAPGVDLTLVKAMEANNKKMRSERGISNMVKLAKSSSLRSADEFDTDPMLLNVRNGIVDLKTGELMKHDPKKFCTNIASGSYNKEAKCPRWDAFLDKILPEDIKDFLQTAVGMAAVGKVYEEAMIFMIGNGSNGKSTIANILSAIFNDYAITLQPDVIKATKDGKTPPDFAEVRGKRIVFISETEEGDRLSTQSLKRLSSNERQSARRLYAMPEQFDPSHTTFYSTNHKPRIGSSDYGTWRRIKNVPFEYKFSDKEKDTSFASSIIEEEADGILMWIIEGARKFIRNGCKLKTPSSIKEATAEYRDDEDYVAQFINEKCFIAETYKDRCGEKVKVEVPSGRLYHEFKEFCKNNTYFTKNMSDFNNSIAGMDGIVKVNRHGTKIWLGIMLKEDKE